MPNLIDLTGIHIDRLEVVERAENHGKEARWLCKCDCGNLVTMSGKALRNKSRFHSCGCYTKEAALQNLQKVKRIGSDNPNYKHGGANSRLYWVWGSMIQRCTNPNNKNYDRYGGRGISVCDEWLHSYAAFQKWALANGYCNGLTIDRKENDGNYCPENCRWETIKEQQSNREKRRWYRKPEEEKTND